MNFVSIAGSMREIYREMNATVYYCWVCDAHRRAEPASDGRAYCPCCEHELTADARLESITPTVPLRFAAGSVVWPAPMRPRLAASA